MKRREPRLDPELSSLLASGKVERQAPPDVRERALAGARAIIAAGGRRPGATVLQFPTPRVARRRAPIWIPIAAALGVAVAVASGASLALRGPTPHASVSEAPATTAPTTVVHHEAQQVAPVEPAPPLVPLPPSAGPARRPRTVNVEPSVSAELDLLSRAQSAYARGDFSRALTLIAEHGRRFPNGHLAEEREALRIRSLARSGHADQSGRAEAAFTQRFPRSVLLKHAENPKSSIAQ